MLTCAHARRVAHRDSGILLEFISLLLSKENPVQASTTLSSHLRQLVGIGTLGATALAAPAHNRLPDHKLMAVGRKLEDINSSADKTLAAAVRLQQEIKEETKYWAEVLAVSENGWPTFHHPQIAHTMGVKFGFANAAAEFGANSTAPMLRGDDGSVVLECAKEFAQPKRLQVTLSKGDRILGRSWPPPSAPSNATLEQRVKEARDTIFAVELWHELNREGRLLLGQNVRLGDSTITYTTDYGQVITLELVVLGDMNRPEQPAEPTYEDNLAETIHATLHLLLDYAHKQNASHRPERSAANAKKGPTPPYALLQPIMTYLRHEQAIRHLTLFLSNLIAALQSAGVATASFKMLEPPITPKPGLSPAEAFVQATLRPTDVQFHLTITPESRMGIIARANPPFGTQFLINLIPPAPSISGGSGPTAPTIEDNPLHYFYPPVSMPTSGFGLQPPGAPGPGDVFYPSSKVLIQYIADAVPRALTAKCFGIVSPASSPQASAPGVSDGAHKSDGGSHWYLSSDATGLNSDDRGDCLDAKEDFGLHFEMPLVGANGEKTEGGRPELRASGYFMENAQPIKKSWAWNGADKISPEKLTDLVALLSGK